MHDIVLMDVIDCQTRLVEESENFSFTQNFLAMQVGIEVAVLCVVKNNVNERIRLNVVVKFDDVWMLKLLVDGDFDFKIVDI